MIREEVVDNVLKEDDLERLQNLIMFNANFPWYLTNEIVQVGKTSPHDGWYGYHMFYETFDPERVNQGTYNPVNKLSLNYVNISSFTPSLRAIVDVVNPKAIVRIKANFYSKTSEIIEAESHHDYDSDPPHQGAIFYLNTCNGFTRVKGEKVMSVANRLLYFDASKEHNSSTCSDEKGRFNINFNYYG